MKYLLQLYLTQQLLENDFTFYVKSKVKYDNLFIHNEDKDKLFKSLQKLKKHNFKLNADVFSILGMIVTDDKVIMYYLLPGWGALAKRQRVRIQ